MGKIPASKVVVRRRWVVDCLVCEEAVYPESGAFETRQEADDAKAQHLADTHQSDAAESSWLDDFRTTVRARLKEDGLSQADLARKLGASQKHLSQVLSGGAVGSPAFLEQVARAVGLRIGTYPDRQR